jgi:hypothetical protein
MQIFVMLNVLAEDPQYFTDSKLGDVKVKVDPILLKYFGLPPIYQEIKMVTQCFSCMPMIKFSHYGVSCKESSRHQEGNTQNLLQSATKKYF